VKYTVTQATMQEVVSREDVMAKRIKLFTEADGLNIKDDPARLKYVPKTGVTDLAVAYNVDITDNGRISRRKGFTQQVALDTHSLFCDGGSCLFVTGDALCILHPDYTYTSLRNVQQNAKMRYAQVDDTIYYLNGWQIGRVLEGLSVSWVMDDDEYGPTTQQVFSDPPIGTDIAHFSTNEGMPDVDS